MPVWICGKCGHKEEGRCRPKACPKCGAQKVDFKKEE